MPNIHAYGEELNQFATKEFDEVVITLTTGDSTTDSFSAHSPPIGNTLLFASDTVQISEHDRVFRWSIGVIQTVSGSLALVRNTNPYPKAFSVITDTVDGSKWTIVLDDNRDAWKWFGQNRTMIEVKTKKES